MKKNTYQCTFSHRKMVFHNILLLKVRAHEGNGFIIMTRFHPRFSLSLTPIMTFSNKFTTYITFFIITKNFNKKST